MGTLFLEAAGGTHEELYRAPEESRVIERAHRTLDEMAFTMLLHAGMPAQFWPEAVLWACRIDNILPPTKGGKSAKELIEGREPSIAWLEASTRVFGCEVFAHKNQKGPKYLFKKADRCVFLGTNDAFYESSSSTFRLWNLSSRKLVITNTATFNENIMPFKEIKPDGDTLKIPLS